MEARDQVRVAFPEPAGDNARALAASLKLSITVADHLARQGFADDQITRDYLDPKLAHLTSPENMLDRDAAIDRICRAITAHEHIALFADYDCDGITSAAIMTEGIRALGGNVVPRLANRFAGGYGLSKASVDKLLQGRPSLLITCDCGSSDHEQLARVGRTGADVIVIDHHLVPQESLPAVAFLNPQREGCGFAYKNLASCGLALSLVAGLRRHLGVKLDVRRWLDLVAIGTVADMVPLDGDNRVLVRAGMRRMQEVPRLGLQVLGELAKVQWHAGITSDTISFYLAPRLNAPGRLGDATDALALLMATDERTARLLAGNVDSARNERRRIQDLIVQQAQQQIDDNHWHTDPALVLAHHTWHPGVVGIVASCLVEQYGVPSIVIGYDGEIGRGSVRGPKGVSVYDLLQACDGVPVGYGGHHAAAGVTVELAKVDKLRECFLEAARHQIERGAQDSRIVANVRLDPADDPVRVADDLLWLEPCGVGNEVPLVGLEGARVVQSREVRGGHLQVHVQTPAGVVLYGFGPRMGHWARRLKASSRIDVIGSLRRDTFRGGDAVALNIAAIELAH